MIGDLEPEGDPDHAEEINKDRRALGEDFASVLMLSQRAIADRLDARPDIRRQLEVSRLQILSDAEFARLKEGSKPAPDELSRYYAAHLQDFDRLRVRRLFLWKKGEGSANTHGLAPEIARERADAILSASKAGSDPLKLAEGVRATDDGMLDAEPVTFLRGAFSPNVEKVAFSMKPGEWAEGENTPDRILLLQLVARDRRPLSEVQSIVEQRVLNDKMQAKLDALKGKSGIWMDEQYFKTPVAAVSHEQ